MKRFGILLTALSLLISSLQIVSVYAGRESVPALSNLTHVFSDALQIVHDRYLREVNPRDLVYGAIRGMIRALDPDSEFLTPEEVLRLRAETEGEFTGIGAKVSVRDDGLLVTSVIPDSPAAGAGLKPGNLIVSANEKSLAGIPRSEALETLRGKSGTAIRIGVVSPGDELVVYKTINRTVVDIPNVKDTALKSARVGYLRIVEFGEKTRGEIEKALEQLRAQRANRFIIDVRDNPGGTLDAASEVSGLFLSRGDLIVSTIGRRSDESFEVHVTETGAYSAAPLAVLINGGSASASEVLAASLRDHGRAKLFGTHSFGKASIQALLTLRDGSAIRITTAEYFTPSHAAIDGAGLEPDFVIEDEDAQLTEAVSFLENLAFP
ncbi:MAG: S41 family peptidase [Candidatus Omnitrophica bacterium]|nr:S41 family peptidase [Candidatus Omnitrophota bacterium]